MTGLLIGWLSLGLRIPSHRIRIQGWTIQLRIITIIIRTLSVLWPGWCSKWIWIQINLLDSRSLEWLLIRSRRRLLFIIILTLVILLLLLKLLTRMIYQLESLKTIRMLRTPNKKPKTDIFKHWKKNATKVWDQEMKTQRINLRKNTTRMIKSVNAWEQAIMKWPRTKS